MAEPGPLENYDGVEFASFKMVGKLTEFGWI